MTDRNNVYGFVVATAMLAVFAPTMGAATVASTALYSIVS